MSNRRVSSDNYNTVSEPAHKACELVFITSKGEEVFRHRVAVYAVELNRLSVEPIYAQFELDLRVAALFDGQVQ